MVSVNYQNNVKVYETSGVKPKVQTAPFPVQNNVPAPVTPPAFRGEAYTSALTVRTALTTKEEKKKYEELSADLNLEYRKKLDFA